MKHKSYETLTSSTSGLRLAVSNEQNQFWRKKMKVAIGLIISFFASSAFSGPDSAGGGNRAAIAFAGARLNVYNALISNPAEAANIFGIEVGKLTNPRNVGVLCANDQEAIELRNNHREGQYKDGQVLLICDDWVYGQWTIDQYIFALHEHLRSTIYGQREGDSYSISIRLPAFYKSIGKLYLKVVGLSHQFALVKTSGIEVRYLRLESGSKQTFSCETADGMGLSRGRGSLTLVSQKGGEFPISISDCEVALGYLDNATPQKPVTMMIDLNKKYGVVFAPKMSAEDF